MTRDSEAHFLTFCIAQHSDFEPAAWLSYDALGHEELATAALFLASVRWYGHERELAAIAAQLHPASTGQFAQAVSRTGFDCSRFSTLLRRQLDHALAPS